ncbi:Eco57I restriction-modification methylase domain-containing protein [Clostridium septicum]|uniref:Eco57I restriction-modification methylase domain-containing protein n=1 Tax=Clostridium septicum TaxID=1504 RepID=UPI003C12C279
METKLYSIKQSNEVDNSLIKFVARDDEEIRKDLEYLVNSFKDAKEYGSILNLRKVNFENLNKAVKYIIDNLDGDLISLNQREQVIDKVLPLINQAIAMTNKYDIVVTNPPYLNSSRMSEKLSKYVNDNFPKTKSDFSMIFYEKAINDYCKRMDIYRLLQQLHGCFKEF